MRTFINLPAAADLLGMSYQSTLKYAARGVLVTDIHGAPLVTVRRIGGTWKVPVAELAVAAGITAAQVIEIADTARPRPGGEPRGPRGPSPRNVAIVDAYRAGATMADLSAEHGISRQRVQQIVQSVDPNIFHDRVMGRRAIRAKEEQERRTRNCAVCGKAFISSADRRRTCSPLCGEAWRIGRRYFSTKAYESHRRATGATGPPNRRYVVPHSKVAKLLTTVGRIDVLPNGGQSRRPPGQPPCTATNLNGTPCRRHATAGADLCHIHAAALERRKVAS